MSFSDITKLDPVLEQLRAPQLDFYPHLIKQSITPANQWSKQRPRDESPVGIDEVDAEVPVQFVKGGLQVSDGQTRPAEIVEAVGRVLDGGEIALVALRLGYADACVEELDTKRQSFEGDDGCGDRKQQDLQDRIPST